MDEQVMLNKLTQGTPLKKIVLLLVAIVMALPILASCQNIKETNTDTPVDSTNTVDITPVLDPELELRMCEDYRLVFNFLPPD
ncbi:MAG: hypothetical protein FWF18_05080, partial [Dehalococcoidia bacterium]|nr:hypothetical protein [Dehalococcoidia bacterium]